MREVNKRDKEEANRDGKKRKRHTIEDKTRRRVAASEREKEGERGLEKCREGATVITSWRSEAEVRGGEREGKIYGGQTVVAEEKRRSCY